MDCRSEALILTYRLRSYLQKKEDMAASRERRRMLDHERYLRQRDERLAKQRAYYREHRDEILSKKREGKIR